MRSDRTHSWSGIPSLDATHASSDVIIFVRQSLSISEQSTFSLSSLDPHSDYLGVNISLNNSSSLSFLNVYILLIRSSPTDSRADSFFPLFFSHPKTYIFWGTSIAITSSGIQEVLPTPTGRKYLTGSALLNSSPSMTLTYLLFFIAPLAVALPLTFPLIPLLSAFLADGRCFRTWILIT